MKHEKINNRSFIKNRWSVIVGNIKNQPFEDWSVFSTPEQITISVDSFFGIRGTKETWIISWSEIKSEFTTDTI
jgi:hypothetical protein